MRPLQLALALSLATAIAVAPSAQPDRRPDRALVDQAKAIVADSMFARLQAGDADALAEWVVNETYSDGSGSTRIQTLSQFESQFRMMTQEDGPFGEMDGYDLLQEDALPGTDRYFRLTYMSYHQEVALVWEIHFYVRPDGGLSIPYLQFNGQNPYVYLSTSDMLLPRYVEGP